MAPLTIGISGCSRSGKSSLAAAIEAQLDAVQTLHGDNFATHALASRHESKWEATESIDHYDEVTFAEWKAHGEAAGEAARRKDWAAARQDIEKSVELRPDWSKGHVLLERIKAKEQEQQHQHLVDASEGAQSQHDGGGGDGDGEEQEDADPDADYRMAPSARPDAVVSMVEASLMSARPAPGSTLVMLTLSGALNPVHCGHVEMMHVAAEALRAAGHRVIAGLLAPSSESYLNNKLGAEALSLADRCALCDLALAEEPWLATLDWGIASSAAIATGMEKLLHNAFPAFTFVGFQVVGADFAIRAKLEGKAGNKGNRYVCLRRHGLTDTDAALQEGWSTRDDFVVASAQPREVSSTRVRQLVKSRKWQELAAAGLLHPNVVRALQQRRWLEG